MERWNDEFYNFYIIKETRIYIYIHYYYKNDRSIVPSFQREGGPGELDALGGLGGIEELGRGRIIPDS